MMNFVVRTASPAMQAALEQSMKELAAAKPKAGFGRQSSVAAAAEVDSGAAEVDSGAALTRTFSAEMYDKMLENPMLVGAQRENIQVWLFLCVCLSVER